MALIKWNGNTLTVTTNDGVKTKFIIKKIKGLMSYNIYRENETIVKGGFMLKEYAKEWITDYIKGWE